MATVLTKVSYSRKVLGWTKLDQIWYYVALLERSHRINGEKINGSWYYLSKKAECWSDNLSRLGLFSNPERSYG